MVMGNLNELQGTLWEPSKSHTNALMRWDEQSTPSSCKH